MRVRQWVVPVLQVVGAVQGVKPHVIAVGELDIAQYLHEAQLNTGLVRLPVAGTMEGTVGESSVQGHVSLEAALLTTDDEVPPRHLLHPSSPA